MSAAREGALLEVRGLCVSYGQVQAVENASLFARPNEITALVGPSGCGKTSLLRAVAGFEMPRAGSISIDGREVAGPGAWVPPERRGIGMVFQQSALFPHLSVGNNVGFGVHGRDDAAERIAHCLGLVGLADLHERYPDELSGGQQQRVALARALAPSPRLVLLDEPFANLDASLRQRMRDEVRSILEQVGTTAVIVTHDQEEALSMADCLVVMRGGSILQAGSAEEIYRLPASATVAELIGDGQLFACEVRARSLECALGRAECDAPDGSARILVRADDLEMLSGDAAGVGGIVERRRFFGHDVLSEVALDSGTRVHVRDSGRSFFADGTAVRLRLRRKRYPVFATDDSRRRIGHATPS